MTFQTRGSRALGNPILVQLLNVCHVQSPLLMLFLHIYLSRNNWWPFPVNLRSTSITRLDVERHCMGTQVEDECETKSVSPAFRSPARSPSIEVTSGATGLEKLLLMFCKDSGRCQTPVVLYDSHLLYLQSDIPTLSSMTHLDGVNRSDR